MLKNYLIVAWRNLVRNKQLGLLNILGLSLGIAGVLVIALVVFFEWSFDRYHTDWQRIYRVVMDDNAHDNHRLTQAIPYPLPEALRADFKEIETLTIVDANFHDPVITVPGSGEENKYKESRGVAFVDSDYFEIFTYRWIEGNPKQALREPKTVVISQSLAHKYFKDQNPIGRLINFDGQYDLKVVGVVADVPRNTDLPFNMLISFNLGTEDKRGWEAWDASSGRVNCYVRLTSSANTESINMRLQSYLLKYRSDEFAAKTHLFLQPLSELHFDTRFSNYNYRVISRGTIKAMSLVGIFILLISCINFINLNTALATFRFKEVGVRKALGGNRRQLIPQFLLETLLITILAVVLAVLLAQIGLVRLDSFLGYQLSWRFLGIGRLTLLIMLIVILVCMLAGYYPALVLSRLKPRITFDAAKSKGSSRGFFRKSLVGAQLVICQIILICTIVVSQQIDYFTTNSMGIDKEAVVEFPMPLQGKKYSEIIRSELVNNVQVSSISFSNTGAASGDSWGGEFNYQNGQQKINAYTQVKFIDQQYLDTYGITLLVGSNITDRDTTTAFLVNQSFVKAMQLANPDLALGEFVEIWGRKAPIAGVVRDFNTRSLHEPIQPCIFMVDSETFHRGAVKFSGNNLPQFLTDIQHAWNTAFPQKIFQSNFLDESIASFYSDEKKISNLLSLFSGLAIIIGGIGLFGLITFVVTVKTKEIGIRKVLGSSVSEVTWLISRPLMFLTLASFLVAGPVSYLFMKSWLSDFSFRIDLGWTYFVAGLFLSILLVVFTSGYKTTTAALANPVSSLRTE